MVRRRWVAACLAAYPALAAASPTGAWAAEAEKLKVAVGQRGNWDTSVSELGQRAGIFGKHGLELDILYTQGGGETQQAVLSRSVDIGVAAGTLGVLGAAAKGAPVRIIGGETTGSADLYWYVPANSPIRSVGDLAGRSVAYSTAGSSTNAVVLTLRDASRVDLKPVATGGPPGTFTQAMSGQIDVGWAAAPFGLEALEAGRIRIVFRGNDVEQVRDQTIRVLITHAAVLAQKAQAVQRYMRAYRETVEWMYSSPDVIRMYSEFVGVPEAVARRTRDEFFPRATIDPDRISGLDAVMADGVRFKFLPAPLTPQQLAQVIQIPKDAP